MSCLAYENNELIGLCLNKIEYSDSSKCIPSFSEATQGQDIFINKILTLMDTLYEVISLKNIHISLNYAANLL